MSGTDADLTAGCEIAAPRRSFRDGALSAAEPLDRVLGRIGRWDDPAAWIARAAEAGVRDRAPPSMPPRRRNAG